MASQADLVRYSIQTKSLLQYQAATWGSQVMRRSVLLFGGSAKKQLTYVTVMQQHRHTVTIQLKPVDYPILTDVQNDKSLRVMVFCCDAETLHQKQDIAFPYQSEIKVNGGDIKANLRGLKSKPGSTRPLDITDTLRLRQVAYVNNVEMTYALTTKAGALVQVSCQAPSPPFSSSFTGGSTSPICAMPAIFVKLTFSIRNSILCSMLSRQGLWPTS